MPPLAAIWITALGLMTLALAWMTSLIVRRLIHEAGGARRAADRRAVTDGLSGLLCEAPGAADKLRPYIGRARLMAETLLEFQGLIRGSDQDRVLGALRELGLVRVLADRLECDSRMGRLTVLEALAALGGEEARIAMRHAIGSSRPEVRMVAVKALADAGYAPSIGRLLDYAVSGELTPSKLYAELVRQITAAAPEATVQALERGDLSPVLRTLAIDALGLSGDYQVLPSLILAAGDDDQEVRTAAVRALGRLQHPAGEAAIGRAMQDERWVVRSVAAEAAGLAGFSRLVHDLDLLLGDPEWWVRFRAGEALVALGGEGLFLLNRTASGERPLAHRAAESALAEQAAR